LINIEKQNKNMEKNNNFINQKDIKDNLNKSSINNNDKELANSYEFNNTDKGFYNLIK